MKTIKASLLLTALAVSTATATMQPAQAQTARINPVGRWQCQSTTQGTARETANTASMQETIVDVSPDGSFQVQGIESSAYGSYELYGGGRTVIERDYLQFRGEVLINHPMSGGMPIPFVVGGVTQDGTSFYSQHKSNQYNSSHACQKIS